MVGGEGPNEEVVLAFPSPPWPALAQGVWYKGEGTPQGGVPFLASAM